MTWLDHPKFKPIRDSVIEKLSSHTYHFRRLKRVLFLCGKKDSARRKKLKTYIARRVPRTVARYRVTTVHIWLTSRARQAFPSEQIASAQQVVDRRVGVPRAP